MESHQTVCEARGQGIEPSAAKAETKIINFGGLPEVQRTAEVPREGEWFVSVFSRGPCLAELGVLASGFKSRLDAERCADLHRPKLAGFAVSAQYKPTAVDRARLEWAPEIAHVPFIILKKRCPPLNDGAEGKDVFEAWASRSEAEERVLELRSCGWAAQIDRVAVECFERDYRGLEERKAFLRGVNGDLAAIEDGSAWSLPEFSKIAVEELGRLSKGHLPGPYVLLVYTHAEVCPVDGVAHSKTAVFGRMAVIQEYESIEAADEAGFALLARDRDIYGFKSWPAVVPDTDPPLCYVARANARSGRLIPRSRLTDFFEGSLRRELAERARTKLLSRWPDAAVFFSSKRTGAARQPLASGPTEE